MIAATQTNRWQGDQLGTGRHVQTDELEAANNAWLQLTSRRCYFRSAEGGRRQRVGPEVDGGLIFAGGLE